MVILLEKIIPTIESKLKHLDTSTYQKAIVSMIEYITEDELKIAENEVQKLTDSNIEEIDKILANKELDIMNV